MLKKYLRWKMVLVVFTGIPLFCSGVLAQGNDYGGGRDRDRDRDHREDHRRDHWEERHYYRDGKWYKHDERGHEVFVSNLVVGAYAESLPPQHTTVIVEKTPYYYDRVYYYRERPGGGYVVVDEPRRR